MKMRSRLVARGPKPNGGYFYRTADGRTAVIADGREDGDGWVWATMDDMGDVTQSEGGYKNMRDAKYAARRALRL
jgi:hypothetical protein